MAKDLVPPGAPFESKKGTPELAAGNTLQFPAKTPSASELKLGKYQLLQCLGKGGMGEVWKGRDPFGNIVAIKILRAGQVASDTQMHRFRKEAVAMSRLQHRGICRIHEVGEVKGLTGSSTFIAMEYVEGASLADILQLGAQALSSSPDPEIRSGPSRPPSTDIARMVREVEEEKARKKDAGEAVVALYTDAGSPDKPGPALPIQQSLAIIIKVCQAIQYVHEHGILHRDLKPANIAIRPDGEPIVLDFGLAKVSGGEEEGQASLSMSGEILGTIEYMAPEQAHSSKDVDEKADVYGIAAILYQMVTGYKHFPSSGRILVDVSRLRDHEPVKPRMHNPGISSDLELIILKALRSDPQERYSGVRPLEEDLKRYLTGEPVLAKKPTLSYRLSKKIAKHRHIAAMTGIICILLASFGGYFLYDYHKQWGDWIPILHQDFTESDAAHKLNRFLFMDRDLSQPVTPWESDSAGLKPVQLEWLWLKDVRIPGDLRMVVRMRGLRDPNALEVCINSRKEKLEKWHHVPPGYSFQFGGYAGVLDFISINPSQRTPDATNAAVSSFKEDRVFTLSFEREEGKITMRVNGRETARELDPLSIQDRDLSRIGLRSHSTGMEILSIDVYRRALPEKASPLLAGDVLLASGYLRDAIAKYGTIAQDYSGTPIAESALAKGYFAVTKTPGRDPKLRHWFLKELQAHHPNSANLAKMYELEALFAWEEKQHGYALGWLPIIFAADPDTKIALRLLGSMPVPVPDGLRAQVVGWVRKTRNVDSLVLSRLDRSGVGAQTR